MQIKTEMRYHFTPVRMTIIEKTRNKKKCWRGCEEKGTLAYDPGFPLLGIYLKNIEAVISKDICTPMFITALIYSQDMETT